MTRGYMLNSDTAGIDGQVSVLATITSINLKNIGATTLLLVPAGKTLIIYDVLLFTTAADTVTVAPIVSVGKAASYNEWLALSTMTGLTSIAKTISLNSTALGLIQSSFAAGETVAFNVGTGATATTLTVTAYLIGILV